MDWNVHVSHSRHDGRDRDSGMQTVKWFSHSTERENENDDENEIELRLSYSSASTWNADRPRS